MVVPSHAQGSSDSSGWRHHSHRSRSTGGQRCADALGATAHARCASMVLRWRILVVAVLALTSLPHLRTASADPDYFATLRPGAELPSGKACATRVRRSPWEPRPENYAANH